MRSGVACIFVQDFIRKYLIRQCVFLCSWGVLRVRVPEGFCVLRPPAARALWWVSWAQWAPERERPGGAARDGRYTAGKTRFSCLCAFVVLGLLPQPSAPSSFHTFANPHAVSCLLAFFGLFCLSFFFFFFARTASMIHGRLLSCIQATHTSCRVCVFLCVCVCVWLFTLLQDDKRSIFKQSSFILSHIVNVASNLQWVGVISVSLALPFFFLGPVLLLVSALVVAVHQQTVFFF